MSTLIRVVATSVLACHVSACGTTVPDIVTNPSSVLTLGQVVNEIASNVRCEIHKAIDFAANEQGAEFLYKWSAKITMTVSADEKTNLAPGVSGSEAFLGSIVTGINVAAGGSYNKRATRKIEVTWFELFSELLTDKRLTCGNASGRPSLNGDLKIRETLLAGVYPAINVGTLFKGFKDGAGPLETVQNTITFTTEIGGSLTPTITFTNVTVNPGGNTILATRDRMDQLLITMGPGQIENTKRPFGKPVIRPSNQVDAAHQTGRIGLEFQNFQQRILLP